MSNPISAVAIREMLAMGDVTICLDATLAGVVVPESLGGQTDLRLRLSYRFRHPVFIEDDAIYATLVFGGVPSDCVIPYTALWGVFLFGGETAYVRPDRVPAEVQKRMATSQTSPVVTAQGPPSGNNGHRKSSHPHLRLVK